MRVEVTREMIELFWVAHDGTDKRTDFGKDQALANALAAVLKIVDREPDPDHEFQEWNDSGNMCHVRNCRLANEEHHDF